MFREYFERRLYPRDTCENFRQSWLFAFQSWALHVATLRVSFSRNPLVLRFKFESSHSYSPLQLKTPYKYRKKWLNKFTIKFGIELKLTQNSCKSQLYSFEKKDKPFGNVLENSTNLRLYMNAGLVGPIKKACIEFLDHVKCMLSRH